MTSQVASFVPILDGLRHIYDQLISGMGLITTEARETKFEEQVTFRGLESEEQRNFYSPALIAIASYNSLMDKALALRAQLESGQNVIPDEDVQNKALTAIVMTYGSLLHCSQSSHTWLPRNQGLSEAVRDNAIIKVKQAAVIVRETCGAHVMEAVALISVLKARIEREDGKKAEILPEKVDEVMLSLVRYAVAELGITQKTDAIVKKVAKNKQNVLATLRYLKSRGEYLGPQ